MCWLCVADPMNSINGTHAAFMAAQASLAEFDAAQSESTESGSAAPQVSGADASAAASDLVNGLNTADPNDAIDTGIFNEDGAMVINYYFMQVGEEIDEFGFNVSPELNFSAFEQAQISAALEAIETFIDVDFVEVDNLADAEMEFSLSQTAVADNPSTPEDETVEGDFGSDFNLGFAFFPSGAQIGSAVTLNADGIGWDREASLDDPDGDDGGLLQGGTGLLTVIHEVGHAMGFDHPFEGNASLLFPGLTDNNNDGVADDVFDDAGDFDLNQDIFTAMSQTQGFLDHPFLAPQGFNDTSARSGGMMAIDIAALQVTYGENEDFAGGDDTYAIEDLTGVQNFYHSIWDTGGTDEITYSGDAQAVIDLRPATLAVEEGGGGFVSLISTVRGGFTIANDVVIENASSGSGDDELTGNEAANALSGGEGADTLIGGGENDTLIGGEGADDLRGGAGVDFASYEGATERVRVDLTGAISARGDAVGDIFDEVEGLIGTRFGDVLLGDDQNNALSGGESDDFLLGRGGADSLLGEDGDDDLGGQDGEDTLEGGLGVDTLDGGADADTLRGGDGDDLLIGGDGADLLDGGADFDVASYVTATQRIRVDLSGQVVATGDASGDVFVEIERIQGTNFDDILLGDDIANDLEGGEGDDDLRGRDGDDTLIGGAGADQMNGGEGSDTASYETATSAVVADILGGLTAVGDAIGDAFFSIENLIGSSFNDRLRGTSADNILRGGDGFDQIFGVRGDDTIFGEDGSDKLLGEDGDDLIDGGVGNDRLTGGEGADVLIGGVGRDILNGGEGFDIASYETGAERVRIDLSGGLAATGDARGDIFIDIEQIRGTAFNDILVGGAGADVLEGAGDVDRLEGGGGEDTLIGGAEGDVLTGGGGDDTASYATASVGLIADLATRGFNTGEAAGDRYFSIENLEGSSQDDDLRGDAGDNDLTGGAGVDILTGRGGADNFVFAGGDSGVGGGNRDVVSDFSQGDGDLIDVSEIDADTGAADDQAFSFVGGAAFSGAAGELRFEAGAGGVTLVQGDVDGDQLADFEIELTPTLILLETDFVL